MSIPLRLIPVLDLMAGQVVHAREGRRDGYRPLVSALSPSSHPADVLDGLLRLYPFQHCYIADLDAILRRGDHRREIAALRAAHPRLEFWVDSGPRDAGQIAAWPLELGRPVLGSESLDAASTLTAATGGILSLDFRGEAFLGPTDLLEQAISWPDDLIVMNLERVGSGRGPDLARLAALRVLAPEKRFYAAGGVRGPADLAALAEAGAAGALLASALHDGRLSPTDLAACHDPGPGDARVPATATGPGRDR